MTEDDNEKLFEASGKVEIPASDWLASFLYLLMRDAANVGAIEKAVREIEKDSVEGNNKYTNGWLAKYAQHLSKRLQSINPSSNQDADSLAACGVPQDVIDFWKRKQRYGY